MTTVTIPLWIVLAGLLAVLLVVILLQALTISHQRAVTRTLVARMRWRTARLAENPKGAPKLVKRWTYEDDCYERGDLPIPEAPPPPPRKENREEGDYRRIWEHATGPMDLPPPKKGSKVPPRPIPPLVNP